MFAAVDMNLRAAPARARFAHRPEIVGGAKFGNPFGRHDLPPVPVGFVIAGNAGFTFEHRGVQAVGRQFPHVDEQPPGQFDGVLLEIVPKREVAQHLEKRVVPQRRPDVLEVVVFAADPHALLGTRRPHVLAAILAEEHVLELVHPGVREQERGVVAGNQGSARYDAVAVLFEETKESAAKVAGRHPPIVTTATRRPRRLRGGARS